jgi:hypothetical protein
MAHAILIRSFFAYRGPTVIPQLDDTSELRFIRGGLLASQRLRSNEEADACYTSIRNAMKTYGKWRKWLENPDDGPRYKCDSFQKTGTNIVLLHHFISTEWVARNKNIDIALKRAGRLKETWSTLLDHNQFFREKGYGHLNTGFSLRVATQ